MVIFSLSAGLWRDSGTLVGIVKTILQPSDRMVYGGHKDACKALDPLEPDPLHLILGDYPSRLGRRQTAGLMPPTVDPLFDKFGISRISQPCLGEISAVALRATFRGLVVEANTHRQRNAFTRNDCLLRAHARQRRQQSPRGVRQRSRYTTLIQIISARMRRNVLCIAATAARIAWLPQMMRPTLPKAVTSANDSCG